MWYAYVCMHVYMWVGMCVFMFVCVHAHVYLCMYVCVRAHACVGADIRYHPYSSTFFFEAGSLDQTPNPSTWLVSLASLLWDPMSPCYIPFCHSWGFLRIWTLVLRTAGTFTTGPPPLFDFQFQKYSITLGTNFLWYGAWNTCLHLKMNYCSVGNWVWFYTHLWRWHPDEPDSALCLSLSLDLRRPDDSPLASRVGSN